MGTQHYTTMLTSLPGTMITLRTASRADEFLHMGIGQRRGAHRRLVGVRRPR